MALFAGGPFIQLSGTPRSIDERTEGEVLRAGYPVAPHCVSR